MRNTCFFTALVLFVVTFIALLPYVSYSQKVYSDTGTYSPVVAVSTNILGWGAITPNVGLEVGMGRRFSLDIEGYYNPWVLDKAENKKLQFILLQPELRFWTCERFNRHFIGLHIHGANYNASGIFNGRRYEGFLAGAGISYGYQWIIGKRWNIGATVGLGWARLWQNVFDSPTSGDIIHREVKNYFGPTRAGVSFIYIIK